MITLDEAKVLAKEVMELDKQEKETKKKLDVKKASLKEFIETNGLADEKGSKRMLLDDVGCKLELVARESVSLNADATLRVLRELGLDDCIKRTETISFDENKINKYVIENVITKDALKEMTDSSISYAFSVKAIK